MFIKIIVITSSLYFVCSTCAHDEQCRRAVGIEAESSQNVDHGCRGVCLVLFSRAFNQRLEVIYKIYQQNIPLKKQNNVQISRFREFGDEGCALDQIFRSIELRTQHSGDTYLSWHMGPSHLGLECSLFGDRKKGDIWISPMTNPLYQQKIQKSKVTTQKTPTKHR